MLLRSVKSVNVRKQRSSLRRKKRRPSRRKRRELDLSLGRPKLRGSP